MSGKQTITVEMTPWEAHVMASVIRIGIPILDTFAEAENARADSGDGSLATDTARWRAERTGNVETCAVELVDRIGAALGGADLFDDGEINDPRSWQAMQPGAPVDKLRA